MDPRPTCRSDADWAASGEGGWFIVVPLADGGDAVLPGTGSALGSSVAAHGSAADEAGTCTAAIDWEQVETYEHGYLVGCPALQMLAEPQPCDTAHQLYDCRSSSAAARDHPTCNWIVSQATLYAGLSQIFQRAYSLDVPVPPVTGGDSAAMVARNERGMPAAQELPEDAAAQEAQLAGRLLLTRYNGWLYVFDSVSPDLTIDSRMPADRPGHKCGCTR